MAFNYRLDLINFLLADVRGGLGPYVGIFLLGQAHWDQASIGLVLTISGLIGISLHAPIGVFIDATRAQAGAPDRRGWGLLAAAAVAIVKAPTMPVVLAADTAMAVLGAVFAPTVAAITVGLVRHASTWRNALPAMPPAIVPAISSPPPWPASSVGRCRSRPCSTSSPCSLC